MASDHFNLIMIEQFSESNSSSSFLTFIPAAEDNEKQLVCRAENPKIPNSAIEDYRKLNVHCEYNFEH